MGTYGVLKVRFSIWLHAIIHWYIGLLSELAMTQLKKPSVILLPCIDSRDHGI